MAKKRIIPKLQFFDAQNIENATALVTTVQFNRMVEMGDPISQAKIFEAQMADELIFIDLSVHRGNYKKEKSLNILRQAAKKIFLPLTIGGGVESLEDIRLFLSNGADKVAINTKALTNPDLIIKASNAYGASTLVASIDYKKEGNGQYYVYSHAGRVKHNISPVEWAIECQKLGVGEILLTCIDNDGMRQGLDINTIKQVSESVTIPVIASGGCGLAKHFSEGFIEGKCDAVSAGTFFCFQDQNIMQTRSQVRNSGVNVRIKT
jgi:imidazole glycerol-phosphate synthase subunit HisF